MAISVEKKKSAQKPTKNSGEESGKVLSVGRHFTFPDKDVFDSVEWTTRDARAGDFFQANVEAPTFWSDSAVGIVAKLYFATINGVRESSIKTLIERVVNKISYEGLIKGYFGNEAFENDKGIVIWKAEKTNTQENYELFKDELTYILLNQFAAFNSPVWFNLGVPGRKQCCSACFLLNVEDRLLGSESITEWVSTEAAIFKSGAGSGVNLSKLRGSMEPLSTGGISSGPIPFIRAADASCGSVKSGNTRRGAKLVCLDVDHPDILDFIDTKVREDERMRVLAENGINMDPSTKEGEKNIAESTSFQNANISVRLSDKFMENIDDKFETKDRIRSKSLNPKCLDDIIFMRRSCIGTDNKYLLNKDILYKIAEAAWKCADPGVMFDDIINSWHTTPSLGRINTSNPCNEVSQNDNTSCNLASLNLVKFLVEDEFAFDDFYQCVDVMITAMDITCSFSELPTKKITENTRNLRQLGLGYSNLGSALMIQGIPYDSDEARDWTASVTSLMTGRAYRKSAEMADLLGSFLHWKDNKESMDNVIQKHMNKCYDLYQDNLDIDGIWIKAQDQWDAVTQYDGFRNSQVTVIAPCGTISFLMDCDTTGCEPAYSLVSYKSLAGGGNMTLVNKSVSRSLERLDFGEDRISEFIDNLKNGKNLLQDPYHLRIFQTAAGDNSISPDGHLRMVAAIQPHISGSISKTINCPEDTSVQDIYDIYMKAWEMGLKCVSVYRDGSKATQVLSTKSADSAEKEDKNPFNNSKLAPNEEIENPPTEKNSDFVAQSDPWKNKNIPQIPSVWVGSNKPALKEELNNIQDEAFKELEKRSKNGRKRIPTERNSLTIKFTIADHEGYITAGMYGDGSLGEIFLSGIGKEGSTLKGMMDAWAISVSLGLQYGVPLEVFANKFTHMRFEPEGITNNKEIRFAKSIVDFIMKWLVSKFGNKGLCEEYGIRKDIDSPIDYSEISLDDTKKVVGEKLSKMNSSEKICQCGSIMMRVGTCFSCKNCGASTGCG